MAVIEGMLLEPAARGIENLRLALGLRAFAFDAWPAYDSIVSEPPLVGSVTANFPVSQDAARTITGSVATSFFDDFYNRIHIRPQTISLGYIISAQTRNFDVWNSYLTSANLTSIDNVPDGATITDSTVPATFGPIQLNQYELTVATEGASRIDATVTFNFLGLNDPELRVTGSRVLAWHFPANWETPVTERLEWLTDVLKSEDGSEQRFRLRTYPRWSETFAFDADGRLRRILENKLHDLGGQPWAVPVWPDVQRTAAPLSVGAMSIGITTTYRDWAAGSIGILLSDDGLAHEAFEVASVGTSSLTLARALEQAWPAGTSVYPARIAHATDPPMLTRSTAGYVSGTVTFQGVEPAARTYTSESPTYRTYPVLTTPPNWRDTLSAEYRRQLAVFDALVGSPHVVQRNTIGEQTQSVTWTAFDRAEADALRKFLYSRAGRHKGIWLPTWSADVVPVDTIGASATSWRVENCGFSLHANGAVGRRDLRIELNDGTVFYRRITAVTAEDASVESIAIDTSLGQIVTVDDVRMISFMAFCRLEDDAVEIEWVTAGVAEASFNLTGPRSGV
jgi:hypothetical protein